MAALLHASEDCASMMQSRKHCLALSARRYRRCNRCAKEAENDGIQVRDVSSRDLETARYAATGLSHTMPLTPRPAGGE